MHGRLTAGGEMKSTEKDRNVSTLKVEKSTFTSGRLNLNTLLKRIKDEEKYNKKNNLIILSGCIAVAALMFLIITL